MPANDSMSLANAYPCFGPSARLVKTSTTGSVKSNFRSCKYCQRTTTRDDTTCADVTQTVVARRAARVAWLAKQSLQSSACKDCFAKIALQNGREVHRR